MLLIILLLASLFASVASAESWQVHETPHFRTLYHQDRRSQALGAGEIAEESYRKILQSIGDTTRQRIEIVVCSTDDEFNRWTRGQLPDWGIGSAMLGQGRIVLRSLPGGHKRWREVIVHELAHLVLHQATGGQRIPRWFHEGVAMWQSQEWSLGRSLSMAATMLAYGVIPLEQIDHVFSYTPSKAGQAYTQSFLAITYLQQRAGPDAVRRLVGEMARGRDFRSALETTCACSYSAFQEGWTRYMHTEYGVLSWASSLFSAPYFWVVCAALFLAVYLLKRRRSKRTLDQWEEEEQQALAASIIEFHQGEEPRRPTP